MLKRSIAASCGLLLLIGWQPSPAAAATMVENVQFAWTDATHTKILITWTETTPVANTLRLETRIFEDSQSPPDQLALGSTTAADPNQLIVNTSYLGYSNGYDFNRIVVTDPGGGEARSAAFDRFLEPTEPRLSVTPEGAMRWTAAPILSADSTPDDPLDLEGTTRYSPRLLLDREPHTVGDCGVITLPTTSEGAGPLPDEGQPTTVSILTSNEWNPRGRGRSTDLSEITMTSLTLTAPASTPYGTPLTLTGQANHLEVNAFRMSECRAESIGAGWETLLEGRNSSTGPWYTIGHVEPEYSSGKYTVTLKNPGAREYRLTRPDLVDFHEIRTGATTPAKQVKATTRVVSAKFIAPVITYGARPQAYLWVDPAGSQRAALQFKNASGVWQGMTYKTLYAGRGIATFAFNRRGVTQFRWWVPGSTTSTGLKVDPVYSSPFSLTVR